MFKEELQALDAAYTNLTHKAKGQLFWILLKYKEFKDRELCPQASAYLKALTMTVHAMIREMDALPDNTLEVDKYAMLKANVEILLPYLEPCIDAHTALENCKSVLEDYDSNHGNGRDYRDWTNVLDGYIGDFNREFMKIKELSKTD